MVKEAEGRSKLTGGERVGVSGGKVARGMVREDTMPRDE
jgi:hypothetical protein